MSRHETKGTDPAHHIIVGWDPPLATYFGQVHKVAGDADDADAPTLFCAACQDVAACDDSGICRATGEHLTTEGGSPDPDDNPICWVGASLPQLKTVDALEAAMQPYLKISPELRTALEDDKAHDR